MLEETFGVEPTIVLELLTIPLFTGVIGYITNWTGVLMLFVPLRFYGVKTPGLATLFPFLPKRIQVLPLFRYDGRMGWQGIVPSRADKMASIAVDKGLAKLGDIRDFYAEMDPVALAEQLTLAARAEVPEIVNTILTREYPAVWVNLPDQFKQAVYARVDQHLPEIIRGLTDELGNNIDQLIDVKLMIIRYFSDNPQYLNDLFMVLGKKELRFMQNFGFYAGGPMGFVLVGVLHLTHWSPWFVLPIGGAIIGWVVNWFGVTMIFEPVFPKWYIPWRQGLLIKRQPEITEGYADMVANQVITLSQIGEELLNGPQSDRTHQILEESLKPAADRALGPAKHAIKAAIGAKEYESLQAEMAASASAIAPAVFADKEFNKRQSKRVKEFVAKQMAVMGPDDFVDMLRSAIKQDEWLLFFHGGVLGIIAGFAHLLLFGASIAEKWS